MRPEPMDGRAVDVAIVGGVAGSALGSALARAGLRVVIVEREAVFRDRVRGEGLHPWGMREAERLGLVPALRWHFYATRSTTRSAAACSTALGGQD